MMASTNNPGMVNVVVDNGYYLQYTNQVTKRSQLDK